MGFVSRLMFGLAALTLALATILNTLAFKAMAAVADTSNLPVLYSGALKVLWLFDSITCAVLTTVFGLATIWPRIAARGIYLLLMLIPGGVSALLYMQYGPAMGAHIGAASAALIFLGCLTMPIVPNERD
ncbi:MAG: hypothetical protein GC166_03690 [Alphaproteobacteria bacterium]|nr:hypothetical protein [Alphaproteobacteria bacterium]